MPFDTLTCFRLSRALVQLSNKMKGQYLDLNLADAVRTAKRIELMIKQKEPEAYAIISADYKNVINLTMFIVDCVRGFMKVSD